MARERILLVEDDEDIRDLITFHLEREGYVVIKAESGEEALSKAAIQSPDLVLLDLMLPKTDGLEVCRRLRADAHTRSLPIIMVTAKGEEPDIVSGLELGADDYVPKPFKPRELIARVRAVLRRGERRGEPAGEDVIRMHDLEIVPARREVRVKDKPVHLTFSEFEILRFLARRPGWVYSRYQIVDAAHGENYPVTDRSVDVQIVGLRRKLGKAGRYIETVRGVGYRFMDREE